jgi:radical SAM superfamily enzyme YgiQ (UPF0313 family)
MKVLLIHPSVREWALPCNLPLGVGYTAAGLREAGVEYRVFDDNVRRASDQEILAELATVADFDLIGISAMCSQFLQVKRWVELAKLDGFCPPIVVGGPISVLGERLVKWLGVSVWRGESEEAFGDAVKGLSWTTPRVYEAQQIKQETLDRTLPRWVSFDMDLYTKNPVGFVNRRKWADGAGDEATPKSMNVLASRGCPRHCTFCAKNFVGQPYRTRSVDSVIDEMIKLRDRYGVKYTHLSDDNATASRPWLLEFCRQFKSHLAPGGCSWGCAGRVDSLDRCMLEIMKDSGCLGVGLGVETGSQRMLDVYRKGVTVAQNEAAIKACVEVFGSADYSLMVGGPGENDESVAESIQLCTRTNTKPAVCFFVTPLPGSSIYTNAVRDGLIPDEEKYLLTLGENGRQIACNVSGRSNQWLIDAKRDLEEATKGLGA